MGRNIWRIALIVGVVAVSAAMLYFTPFNLGLDLKGGVHVVLEAQQRERAVTAEDMQGALTIIERRVNALGVSEPVIQRQGSHRIIVQLPGIHDQQQAVDTIGKTALLEFKDPFGRTVLTGANLKGVQLGTDRFGRPAIDLEFDREGTERFADMTIRYQGQITQILLDGEILQEVMINEPILEGKAQITGSFALDEARNYVILFQEGALPIPMKIMEIRNVGPTLGQDSVSTSFRAGTVGVLLVLAFMAFYYKAPGLVADLALVLYVVIALGVLSGMNAVLTLPGIAGFILSIGMAVDANVLIFERIKEEAASGKRLRSAVQAGFKRAFGTILDSNITTLISAAVLFYLGTGAIKGFAVTLAVGILTSMFTAVFVTRVLLEAMVNRFHERMARDLGVQGVAK